jgi:hypothetical protein
MLGMTADGEAAEYRTESMGGKPELSGKDTMEPDGMERSGPELRI